MVGLRLGRLLHHLLARAGRGKLDAAGAARTVGHVMSPQATIFSALQARNFRATEAEGGQILVGMLAQQGGAMAHAAGRLAHLDGHARDLGLVVEAGMGHRHHHVAGGEVRIGEDVAHVVDRRERHLAAEMRQQLLLGALAGEGRDGGDDLVLVGAAVLHGGEPRIGAHLGPADQAAQDRPVRVGMGGDGDVAVLGREHAERAEQGMVVAFRHRHAAGVGMLVHDALAHRQDGVDHADIDELALAGLVGAQDGADDADGAHGGGHQVADAGADLHRRVLVGTGDRHDAAEGLGHDVVGRPVGVGAACRCASRRSRGWWRRPAWGNARAGSRSRGPGDP